MAEPVNRFAELMSASDRSGAGSGTATSAARGWELGPKSGPHPAPPVSRPEASPAGWNRQAMHEIRGRVHRRLLERLNLSNLESSDRAQAAAVIQQVVHELLVEEKTPLNLKEREGLVGQVLDEIFGLGPLEPLLKDAEISDILVNTHQRVFVERRGKLELTEVRFQDERHLRQILDRIVSAVGRRIDESSPMVDARLLDGSRINAVIPPLSIDGPHLSIRKFKQDALTGLDLLRNGSLTAPMLRVLEGIVKARLNIVISGGTGAGKTTLLNIISSFIPHDERVVTIENAAELQLQQPHVVRLETRPSNSEGLGEVTQRSLLVNALRMRPDRIIVGEVRGAEAIDMLQAMNTGHAGSINTLHANSPRDAISRLETMAMMSDLNIPERALRQQIASAVDVIIQVNRLQDGTRKVTSISEIIGMEGDIVTMQEIFAFEQQGVSETGQVIGRYLATGIRPSFTDKLKAHGFDLPANIFSAAPDPGRGQAW